MLAQVKRALSRQYPFAHAIHLAAKSSVTKLTHQDDMFVQRDYSEALDRRPAILLASGLETSGSRPAREIGTAAHLVISKLDLKRPVTLSTIERMRDRLVKEDAIPASIAADVDTKAILGFFESELGSLACDKRNTIWQEWPFTFGLRACESNDPAARARSTADEIIVVQGVIDLLVQTPAGLLVIDFKTDHVAGAEVARRAESYRGQLDLYARAAASIRRERVLARWLYFFAPRQAVEV